MPLEILVVPSQKVVGGSNVWVRGPYDDQNHVWFCGWHGNMPDDKWWETAPRRWSLIGWERWTLDTDMMNQAYYNYPRPGKDYGCAPGVPAEGHSSYIYGRLPHSVQYHPNATIKDPDLRYFDKGGGKGKKVQAKFSRNGPVEFSCGKGSSSVAEGQGKLGHQDWDCHKGPGKAFPKGDQGQGKKNAKGDQVQGKGKDNVQGDQDWGRHRGPGKGKAEGKGKGKAERGMDFGDHKASRKGKGKSKASPADSHPPPPAPPAPAPEGGQDSSDGNMAKIPSYHWLI